MRTIVHIVGAFILLSTSSATVAAAPRSSNDPIAEAQSLGEKGLKAFDAGDYKNAADLFSRAEERFHAITFIRKQANSLDRLGYLIEAQKLYQKVIQETLPVNAPKPLQKAQRAAKEELESVSRRIASLQISIKEGSPGIRVFIDGAEIAPDVLSKPIPQNPGLHAVVVVTSGYAPIMRSIWLKEKRREPLEFEELPPSEAQPLRAPIAEATNWIIPPVKHRREPPPPPPAKQSVHIPTVTAISAGAVLLSTTIVVGSIWIAKNQEIFAQCTGHWCPEDLSEDITTARSLGAVALMTLFVGSPFLAGGITLAATRKPNDAVNPTKKATLRLGPGSLMLQGSF